MRNALALVAFLFLAAAPARAQNTAPTSGPVFYAFVDTLGVAPVAPDTYVTWIFSASVPYPTPMVSSAILVAFDCKAHKVARLSHIVYALRPDSLGVQGAILTDPGTWVDVSVPATFDLVCSIGATRPYKEEPDVKVFEAPEPDPKSLYPIS